MVIRKDPIILLFTELYIKMEERIVCFEEKRSKAPNPVLTITRKEEKIALLCAELFS